MVKEKTAMSFKAPGKINLTLDVVRRRDDGYHEVKMIMQTVDLHDVITLTALEPGIERIVVETDNDTLPTDENNLVYKAAKLLMDEFHINQGIRITLEKNIPIAAGMAGGSSDAATVLCGINEMFGLGLSKEELMKRGVTIGADVPYCVMGKTALAEGIGEKLTSLKNAPRCFVLLAKPDIDVSTKFVYENLHANELKYHPDVDKMIERIEADDLEGVCQVMGNVLETVTIPAYPVIEEIKNIMKENGAVNAMMSGSGPTVFGIYDSREKAEAAYRVLEDRNKRTKDLAKLVVTTLV